MGCCCSKELSEDEDERTPLLGEKHISRDGLKDSTPTTLYVPADPSEPVNGLDPTPRAPEPSVTAEDQSPAPGQPSEPHHNVSSSDDLPESPSDDVTPATVSIKPINVARYDEQIQAAIVRYHSVLERYEQLQGTTDELRQMYPDYNKTHTMDGCFYHVRNLLGDNLEEAVVVKESDPSCPWITYKVETIHHSLLPALNTFNKASRLVKEVSYEQPQLLVALDDLIFAEADMHKEIDKTTEADRGERHLKYDLKQLSRVKMMLGKIINQTQHIAAEMKDALNEIKGTKSATVSDPAGVSNQAVDAKTDDAAMVEKEAVQQQAGPAVNSPDPEVDESSKAVTEHQEVSPKPAEDQVVETPAEGSKDPAVDVTPPLDSPTIINTPASPSATDESRRNESLEVEPPTPAAPHRKEVTESTSTDATNDSFTTAQAEASGSTTEAAFATDNTSESGVTPITDEGTGIAVESVEPEPKDIAEPVPPTDTMAEPTNDNPESEKPDDTQASGHSTNDVASDQLQQSENVDTKTESADTDPDSLIPASTEDTLTEEPAGTGDSTITEDQMIIEDQVVTDTDSFVTAESRTPVATSDSYSPPDSQVPEPAASLAPGNEQESGSVSTGHSESGAASDPSKDGSDTAAVQKKSKKRKTRKTSKN